MPRKIFANFPPAPKFAIARLSVIGYCFHVYICTVGSRMKKDWVEVITKTDAAHDGEEEEEQQQHWLLTCVRTNTLCVHDSSGVA